MNPRIYIPAVLIGVVVIAGIVFVLPSITSGPQMGIEQTANTQDAAQIPKTENNPQTSTQTSIQNPADTQIAAGLDPCLEGGWVMDRDILEKLLTSVIPVDGLSVPSGELTMEFSGKDYIYSGRYTIRMTPVPSTYGEAQVQHTNSGTFYAADNSLSFKSDLNITEPLLWTAYQKGKVVSTGGKGPTYDQPAPGGGPYKCTESALELVTRGANETKLTMFFKRKI